MKTIYINSYYSEIDYSDVNNSSVDGIYLVTYDDSNFTEHDITHLIHTTYERMQEENDEGESELVHNLGEVLQVLQKEHNIVSWEEVESIKFDCDYGIFDGE